MHRSIHKVLSILIVLGIWLSPRFLGIYSTTNSLGEFIIYNILIPAFVSVIGLYCFLKFVPVRCTVKNCNGKGYLESDTEIVDNILTRIIFVKGHRCEKCDTLIDTHPLH